jgi:hypothetical protein
LIDIEPLAGSLKAGSDHLRLNTPRVRKGEREVVQNNPLTLWRLAVSGQETAVALGTPA